MKSIRTLALVATLLAFSSVDAQTPAIRGLYIDEFSQILGNSTKEDSLLDYAQDSSFNYLALYELHAISFTNATKVNQLASFIRRARENFGVQYVGAVGESYSTFQSKIAPYNNGRTNSNEKFNVFNLEFEFWISASVNSGMYYCTQYLIPNGCSCDTSGAFKFFMSQIKKIDSLATIQGALSETYVGWFNQGQGQQIGANLDRVLLHAYRTDASSVYGYSKARLSYLASSNQQVDVVPIFSSEPDFMGPWMSSHSKTEPFTQFVADFNADNAAWKPYIRLLGYHWFDYGFMPKPIPGSGPGVTASVSASGPTSFCAGGNVVLTASGGSTYLWSNGATTSSITVNTTGAYSCQTTLNGVSANSSTINVTVNTLPSASFSSATAIAGLLPLTSTSSAGSGTISSYQWYFNGNAIGGATSNSYSASSNGDYSLRVTNSNGCSQTSASQTIVLPIASCLLSTPSGCASFNISQSSVMVSWNNLPSCDSIIVRYKREGTNTYYYIRLPYTGNDFVTIPNIIPNAKYSWRVKTSCGSQYSDYSLKKYFTIYASQVSIAYAPEERIERINIDTETNSGELITYPNPVRDIMRLNFFADNEESAEVMMMDLSGRVVLNRPFAIIEGENTYEVNTIGIPSGVYFASVKTGSMNLIKRIVIQ
ncbi:MAG: T9SS type A sorting domain-containing protein [Bacteroidia bacterium]|nr:T9SS type A sorting domain-containing protein [Bacteroidia bacterium]